MPITSVESGSASLQDGTPSDLNGLAGAAQQAARNAALSVGNSASTLVPWQSTNLNSSEATALVATGAASTGTGEDPPQILGNLLANGSVVYIQGNSAAYGPLGDVNVGPLTPTESDGGDTLLGGDGSDSLTGSNGGDTLLGGDGGDTLTGSDGGDTLLGGDGGDTLTGSDGGDTLLGGDGGDTLTGSDGGDTLTGGDGDPVLVTTTLVPTYVILGDGGVMFTGPGDGDTLTGSDGGDTLTGSDGGDTLTGSDGGDTLTGSDGGDVLDPTAIYTALGGTHTGGTSLSYPGHPGLSWRDHLPGLAQVEPDGGPLTPASPLTEQGPRIGVLQLLANASY